MVLEVSNPVELMMKYRGVYVEQSHHKAKTGRSGQPTDTRAGSASLLHLVRPIRQCIVLKSLLFYSKKCGNNIVVRWFSDSE